MRTLIYAVVATLPLWAQETVPSEWREKVEDALKEGRERVALSLLAKEIESSKAAPRALELFADVAWNVGEFDRAEAACKRWLEEHPQDAQARVTRARQLWKRGGHQAALDLLQPALVEGPERDTAPKWNFPAVALAGEIRRDLGKRDEAEKLFDRLVTESQRIVIRDPKDLAALATAVASFGGKGVKLAEEYLADAQKALTPSEGEVDLVAAPAVDAALGRVYLHRMYLWGDSSEEHKAALKKRPAYVPALIGLASAYEANPAKQAEAKTAIDQAAGVSPGDPDVLTFLVRRDLGDFQPEKAAEKIARGLLVNPKHKELLALKAAREIVLSHKDEGEKVLEGLMAIDPTYGEGLRVVASVLNERRRWPECLELMKRAVAIDPKDPVLFDDYARYLLYLGQNQLAQEQLKHADAADTFSNWWRTNIWEVLRWLGKHYATVDTEKFQVRFFKDDLNALSKIMLPFVERSYGILSKKYGYVPAGVGGDRTRMLLEVFRNHQTFSVRTAGFNGLGALGVCFGPFIAMDGPGVEGMGTFSWARTFHHELAHTMTLGISKGRVPRWLTEGLSTFEEAEFDPAWTRGMDRDLFDAWKTGDLLDLADFDSAFGTPRIIFAYYQGGLEAGYLVKTYGLEKVIEALRLFGQDLPQEEVFVKAFGVATAEIDAGFEKFVAERLAPMRMQPRYRPDVLERMEAAWKAKPADQLLVPLAWARFQHKKLADAEALLAEAQKRGLSDPTLVLLEARIAEKLGRSDRAQALFADLEKSGIQDYDLSFDLAKAAERKGNPEEAMKRYREAIACFPSNPDAGGPRTALARLLRGGGKADEAIALLEEHLRHAPDDLKSRRDVIEYHRAKGNQPQALEHLEKFVLTQPLDEGIQKLRADVLLGAGKTEEALLAAECAAEVSKNETGKASALVVAAEALVKLGRIDEARGRLEIAVRIAPKHAGAARALAELDSRPAGDESRPPGDRR